MTTICTNASAWSGGRDGRWQRDHAARRVRCLHRPGLRGARAGRRARPGRHRRARRAGRGRGPRQLLARRAPLRRRRLHLGRLPAARGHRGAHRSADPRHEGDPCAAAQRAAPRRGRRAGRAAQPAGGSSSVWGSATATRSSDRCACRGPSGSPAWSSAWRWHARPGPASPSTTTARRSTPPACCVARRRRARRRSGPADVLRGRSPGRPGSPTGTSRPWAAPRRPWR